MTYRISKTFTFAAAHQLDHLPAEHKCARLHGHNYAVTVILDADALDDDGFVEDYGRLADVGHYLDTELDHRNLNDVLGNLTSTAEHLAWHLFHRFAPAHPTLREVIVSETPKTTASYRP